MPKQELQNTDGTAFDVAIKQAQQQFESAAANTGMDWRTEAVFALQACATNPFLADTAKRNPLSLRMAMVNIAAIGISLNPAQGNAYLVPRDGQVILDISYRGLLKIATDTGSILWGKAELVYAGDTFTYKGPAQLPVHECDPFSDNRGEFRGVYCVAKTADGEHLVETMSAGEIYKIRDMSDLYRKKKAGPWVSWFGEQAKKTVLKRAQKTWPKSNQRMATAIDYLNREAGEGIDFKDQENGGEREVNPIPSDEMIDELIKQQVAKVVKRAMKANAFAPAKDYLSEKYTGEPLAWANEQLRKAEERYHAENSVDSTEAEAA